MAYTASFSNLPDPSRLDAGSGGATVTAGMADIAETVTGLHALCVPRLPGQRFLISGSSSIISLTGAASEPSWSVRYPVVTDAHDLRVIVWARAPSGGGDIIVSTGADSDTIAVSGSTLTRYTATVSPDTGAAYDDLQLDIDVATGSDTVELWQVEAEYIAKTSPLSSGVVSIPAGTHVFEPVDLAMVAADQPLDAALGQLINTNLRHIRERVATVPVMWGGAFIDPDDDFPTAAGINAAYATLGPQNLRAPVFVRPGALRAGHTYQVWAYVVPDGSVDTYVRVSAGLQHGGSANITARGVWPRVVQAGTTDESVLLLTATAGGAAQWLSGTMKAPEAPPGLNDGRLPHSMCDVGVTLIDRTGERRTTATVRRLSVWG